MRYIDADKFIAELEQEKTEALEFEDGVAVYEIEHTMNLIGMQPTADVVPKSEVEELIKSVDDMFDLVCTMTGLELTYYGKYAELKKEIHGGKR